jgi:hypothetical protein
MLSARAGQPRKACMAPTRLHNAVTTRRLTLIHNDDPRREGYFSPSSACVFRHSAGESLPLLPFPFCQSWRLGSITTFPCLCLRRSSSRPTAVSIRLAICHMVACTKWVLFKSHTSSNLTGAQYGMARTTLSDRRDRPQIQKAFSSTSPPRRMSRSPYQVVVGSDI